MGINYYPNVMVILGKSKKNNKGVSQGSPLSATLFIIYDEQMIRRYRENLALKLGNNTQQTITRTKEDDYEWANSLYRKTGKEIQDGEIERHTINMSKYTHIKEDAVKLPGDTTIKTNNDERIYIPK